MHINVEAKILSKSQNRFITNFSGSYKFFALNSYLDEPYICSKNEVNFEVGMWDLPAEPPAAADVGAVQRRARHRVPKYLDQFGKTKVHASVCAYYGQSSPPASCPCPLRQAWGSLDALIGRLRAAYEESGHAPESNPFAARAVRIYLREVRDAQAKARGIPYEKKKRKRTQPPPPPPPQQPGTGGEASSSSAGAGTAAGEGEESGGAAATTAPAAVTTGQATGGSNTAAAAPSTTRV
ncbi:hypothetical protein GUJ93_ZPchr0033g26859 [Zizania palustris]|uniref:ALOG domain-containing protein n=1 Tax=Zizania palustris TaxID=103762 RepID=A0A8J5R5U2_ZIZPA|nr:hypothetical protein GUJ93_ZPchr0033g26859 [Zizania palustris]